MRWFEKLALGLPALLTLGLAGCGASPTAPMPQMAPRQFQAQSAQPAPSLGDTGGGDSGGANNLNNNPILLWIKQSYPDTAAQIIDAYLSPRVMGAYNPQVEAERTQLRNQAIDTVARSFLGGLVPNLPQGLNATVIGQRVAVSGMTEQFDQEISVTFAFQVTIDPKGCVWITLDRNSISGSSPSLLVDVLGGDLKQKVTDAVVQGLDVNGPPNAAKYPGLTYTPGGTFRVDPGLAFMKMQ